jgi:hypothetical protein
MDNLTDELRKLREDDPELSLTLDGYAETRRAYREALEARRIPQRRFPGSSNSANITVSAQPTVSLPEHTIPASNNRRSGWPA